MSLLAVRCTPSARSLSSSLRPPCSEACSRSAPRSFRNGRTTGSTVSRVGKPAAIADGRGPGIDFGLRHPGCDVGFCGDEVVEYSCRARSMADCGWGSRPHGEGGPPLASRLHPAHSLSGFLSRQEPDVRSSHYNPQELEMNHAPYRTAPSRDWIGRSASLRLLD